MGGSDARPGPDKGFAFGALALAWVLYILYFFLPVTGPEPWGAPDSSLTGAQTFQACFAFPVLWPVAAGHVLFWGGSVLLAMRRWRWAAIAGLSSLAVSVLAMVWLWPAYVGMYCKVLAMMVVSVSATVAIVANPTRPGEPSAAPDRPRE
jgi:hypothetical protein